MTDAVTALPRATLVDTCVLIDILDGDPTWEDCSASALAAARNAGRVVINPLTYAEVSLGYATKEALDSALSPDLFDREPLPWDAGFLAAKAFLAYRRRGGDKRSPLPDFYIGARAAVSGYQLLTRDVVRYRAYCPRLAVVGPE
ncbi:type II toxin-antitoxin system VapC family toxin [Nocardia sp. AG03]|uniref:type II toxin-antitoxin system VapC family toxin n=1 Tax=Nocardia sp. AG03 TaxID=3025312 RepID=UPI002418A0CB|nr:type II toxin-antitoxin system VapC family toxin [Nocardia sp. AG03]